MYNYDTYIKTENGMDLLNSNAPNVEIMIGATAESDGKEGLVPAPVSENKDKYLKGDGTWSEIESAKELNKMSVVIKLLIHMLTKVYMEIKMLVLEESQDLTLEHSA